MATPSMRYAFRFACLALTMPAKKTQGVRLNDWKAKPTDIDSDRAGLVHWQECYGALWQLKLAFEKQHNG